MATNAFQQSAFQQTPQAFQIGGPPPPITVDAGSSISGGQWSKRRWHKFVGGIEAEARNALEAKRAAARTKDRKAQELKEANKIVEAFHRENARRVTREEAAAQSKALAIQHALQANASARHVIDQLGRMHLIDAQRRAQFEAQRRVNQDDDEAALLLLLDHLGEG